MDVRGRTTLEITVKICSQIVSPSDHLESKSAKDSSRKEYLLMPIISGFANHGSIMKTGYTFDEEVQASSSAGLSCSRSPLRNQCMAAVCFFGPDMIRTISWAKKSQEIAEQCGIATTFFNNPDWFLFNSSSTV